MTRNRCLYLLLIPVITQTITTGVMAAASASAGGAGSNYQGQATPRSNVNEVTDFFQVELEKDRAELDDTLKFGQDMARAGIESGSSAHELEKDLELEGSPRAKASELSSVPDHDLENRGMKARHGDCAFYDESNMEVDYSEPLIVQHKKDVDHILNGCNDFLGKILGGLKELGIDCKAMAGNKEQSPEYNVYKMDVPDHDKFYTKHFCEQLRNVYRCNNSLTTRCAQVIGRPANFNITVAHIPIIRQEQGYLQAGYTNSVALYGGDGMLFNFSLSFNIAKAEAIESFVIGSLRYDDFVLVKLNDVYIWSGPFGGHKLEVHGVWIFTGVVIDDSGREFSPENNTWFSAPLNINLKPNLRDGANTLSVSLVVGGRGGLIFDLYIKERECVAWQDLWEETCTLN